MTVSVVLALHLAVIALLLLASRVPIPGPTSPPLELVFLPPEKAPLMLADSARPKHLKVDVGITVAPPSLDGLAPPAPATQADGSGSGVNWTAEAHRALKAYEIRKVQNVQHTTLGLSSWDGWLPEWQRQAGARIRTERGDWVVWINDSCYQVASWRDGAPLPEAVGPQTICIDGRAAPPAIPNDQLPDEVPQE